MQELALQIWDYMKLGLQRYEWDEEVRRRAVFTVGRAIHELHYRAATNDYITYRCRRRTLEFCDRMSGVKNLEFLHTEIIRFVCSKTYR
jgi:hypothetical protein